MGDYVSAPQTVQQDWLNITPQQPDFGYNLCSASGDGGCDVIMSSMALSPSSAGSLASPTFPPTGGFPEQPLVYGGQDENGYSSSQQRQPTDTVAALSSAGSFAPPRPPAASSKHPKLRSASRTSKNVQPRPDETPRERKSRNSHNLVEKQYRNRLNLQFESLMNALPESMRNSAASGGGDGATSERLELGERRLSKAQVLDMSTRYIKTLESDREALERENGELVKGIEILKDLLDKEVRDSDSCIPDIGNVGRGERR
ncbi:hypothetical protein QBC42DRAFT_275423 [Cladorrhinum samala]|uniref:BHLH domain-containing protein n=1 Tax=Cladorrhinum samala TaxID=585594 RepID=A0AAV9HEB8_9PEZI|nr:hypothetical protein QBC42DRAFT_275423 [Cladorrhinum samala]